MCRAAGSLPVCAHDSIAGTRSLGKLPPPVVLALFSSASQVPPSRRAASHQMHQITRLDRVVARHLLPPEDVLRRQRERAEERLRQRWRAGRAHRAARTTT